MLYVRDICIFYTELASMKVAPSREECQALTQEKKLPWEYPNTLCLEFNQTNQTAFEAQGL